MSAPETRYAKAADGVHIAYQVVGEGALDLVLVHGFVSHVELEWEDPHLSRFFERLSSFSRLILFDKRGTGLSDRLADIPTLEQRMDDVRTVMDAAGSERAALMGISEGAPMCALFAATYPQRTRALVLHGGMARSTWAPDYPWASPAEGIIEAATEMIVPYVFTGEDIYIWAPSLADDRKAQEWLGRFRRSAVSPGGLNQLFLMFLDIDVRHLLPSIRVPTLVLHRRGDRVVNRRAGEWMASQIPGARYLEFPGSDHLPWVGDSEPLLDEIQEFLTGARPAAEADRVLATLLFTDIVTSTERSARVGDRRWKDVLDQHDAIVRRELERHRGRLVKDTGDGVLATFDGPARGIRCAQAIVDGVRTLGIEVRAGLHTGEFELRGEDVAGLGVNIAARVMEQAGASEVVVSSTVKDLVAGSGVAFEERGARELRGVPGEWRLYSAVSA